jgi:hypothetical protein
VATSLDDKTRSREFEEIVVDASWTERTTPAWDEVVSADLLSRIDFTVIITGLSVEGSQYGASLWQLFGWQRNLLSQELRTP